MELLFVVAAIVIMLFGFSLLYLELRRRSLQEKNDMLLRQKEIELLRQQVAANQTKEQTLLLKSQETSTSVDALNRQFQQLYRQIIQLERDTVVSGETIEHVRQQVSAMNQVMINKKARGNWGEYQLQMLLELYAGECREVYETQYKLDNGTKLNQLIYEKYLNGIQSLRILFSIDEESIHNPQILKRLCDITAIFAVGKRIVLGQFIKLISNNGIVDVPALIDIRTKVWNKENVDISVLKQLENIFMFTNFTINSINAVMIMQPLDEDKSISFRNIYRNILSNDCMLIVKNNANPEITELFRHVETINAYGSVISVYVLATA